MDVMGDVVWHQTHIVQAQKGSGDWNVDVEKPGRYRFTLRRWPEELGLPIDAAASEEDANRVIYGPAKRRTIHPEKATLRVEDVVGSVTVKPGDESAVIELELKKTGPAVMYGRFIEGGEEKGAYYVTVERMR